MLTVTISHEQGGYMALIEGARAVSEGRADIALSGAAILWSLLKHCWKTVW